MVQMTTLQGARAVLQVGEVGYDWFCVYLIPETLRVTTLGERREGQIVNIEIDTQTQVHALDHACLLGSTALPLTPYPTTSWISHMQAIVDTVEQVVARHLAATQQLLTSATV